MPQLFIFLAGVATTGYTWYRSSADKEQTPPTLADELKQLALIVLVVVLVALFIRWFYKQGTL